MPSVGFVGLFEDYWWLLFPLGFFVAAGFGSWMNYKRTEAKLEVLKAYAAAGKEPPADLVSQLESRADDGDKADASDGGGTTAFLFVLFAGLAGVFAVVGRLGLLDNGDEMPEFYFIAAILSVLAVAFLASGVFGGFRRRG